MLWTARGTVSSPKKGLFEVKGGNPFPLLFHRGGEKKEKEKKKGFLGTILLKIFKGNYF